MIDPHSLELTSTLLSLATTYMSGKENRSKAQDAAAFRSWLEREAFPLLLESADQTLASVIAMKASQHEQLVELLDKVGAIHAAVVPQSSASMLAQLKRLDRALLLHVFDVASQEGPFEHFDLVALQAGLAAPADEIVRSARWLEEKGWMRVAESSGGWSCSPTAAGIHFAWTATHASAAASIERLRDALPSGNACERLGALASSVGVPIGLVYSTVMVWADQGLLTFDDDTWPVSGALVHDVSESLRRDRL